jgi:PqqD family protein of HPr-rel-A system
LPAMKPRVREDLEIVELDGEAVIYDEDTRELHHLNPAATIVLSLCDGTLAVKEMAAEISSAFGMAADEVEPQVRKVLKDFRKAGLLDGGLKVKVRDHG